MNRQNFINSHGRFPVSTEALSFLQNQILAVHDFVQVAGPFAIIKDSTAAAAGLAVVNGELMPLSAAATTGRNFIQVVTQTESVDAGGLHFADVRVTRTAVYRSAQQGGECYPVANFTSISTITAITQQLNQLNSALSGLAGSNSVSELATQLAALRTTLNNSVDTINSTISAKETALTSLIGGKVAPVGSIVMWSGSNAPADWMICDGTHLNSAQYPALFAVIGHTYGGYAQDDFCIPDMRGRYVAGKGANDYNSLGSKGGANRVTLGTDEMPSHTHLLGTLNSRGRFAAVDQQHSYANPYQAIKVLKGYDGGNEVDVRFNTRLSGGGSNDQWGAVYEYDWLKGVTGGLGTTGGGQSHENRPPFIVMNYIIKVK